VKAVLPHKKYSSPFVFFLSIHCVSSVLLYTSTGINIQFGLFDLLSVFSTLNSTLRFSIFQNSLRFHSHFESIINWSFERFEFIHPSIVSSLFVYLHCSFFPLCLHFPSLAFKIILHLLPNYPSIAYLFLYIFSCFLFPVPSQYLLNNLNFSHFTSVKAVLPIKNNIAFPLFFSYRSIVLLQSCCTLQLALTYSLAS
jgi:hypothetical protein